MPPPLQTLVTLRERLGPMVEMVGQERRRLPQNQLAAAGSLALVGEQQVSSEQHLCAYEIRDFIGGYIPQEMIDSNPANDHLLELASNIMAKNWLAESETAEESQVLTNILLPVLNAVQPDMRADAAKKLSELRGKYGSERREEDTTRGILMILSTDRTETPDVKFINRSLTPEQYQQLLLLRKPEREPDYDAPDSSPLEVVWVNNRPVFRKR